MTKVEAVVLSSRHLIYAGRNFARPFFIINLWKGLDQ